MHSPLMADLSSNNAQPNLGAYARAGHVAIGIKATEGLSYVNPFHRGWALRAGLRHLSVWHYHFARPDENTNPEAEAAFFLHAVHGLLGPRDYVVLDFERSLPSGFSRDPAWTRAFDTHIRAHVPYRTILYGSRSWLQESDAWLERDPKRVWDAAYSTEPDYAPPGYTCFARQFTDGVFGPEPHELPGIGRCDVSRLSRAAFAQITRPR